MGKEVLLLNIPDSSKKKKKNFQNITAISFLSFSFISSFLKELIRRRKKISEDLHISPGSSHNPSVRVCALLSWRQPFMKASIAV